MKTKTRIIAALTALLLVCAALASCGSLEKKLVGTWKGQNSTLGIVTEYSYTFNENGTGKYTGVAGVSASFTWTLEDSTLKMVATGAILDLEIFNKSYTVSVDGDKLTLTDSDSTSVTLTKVNS